MKSLSLGGILRDAEQTGASNQAKAVDMATWAPRLYDTYPFNKAIFDLALGVEKRF